MICLECAKENKTSIVYPGSSMRTLMYCQPFYDRQGIYHDHDDNTTTTDYKCSNGHAWRESNKGSCPCGWRG